ncbi:ankyrin repeat-containing domain protein [Pavlovales sp. CCMP2436]|nr:ankyrin repeat-containing domain protein [Pavlovales sp. CCMP2436]
MGVCSSKHDAVAPFVGVDPLGAREAGGDGQPAARPAEPAPASHDPAPAEVKQAEVEPIVDAPVAIAPAAPAMAAPAMAAQGAKVLLRAIKGGDLAAVLACWEAHGPHLDLERRSMWENTSLLCAAYYGHEGVALQLLELGADPRAQNEHGCTALLFAAVERMPRLMRALLVLPAVEPAPAAALVYSRATDETAPRTPLLAAAEGGFAEGVAMLLARDAQLVHPGGNGISPLLLAARRGHAAVCTQLMHAGAGVALTPRPGEDAVAAVSPLRAAVAHGHTEAALAVVQFEPAAARAEPGLVPLAAAKGLPAVCRALIEAGCAVDTPAADGTQRTALHLAARRNDAASVLMLLEMGADPTLLPFVWPTYVAACAALRESAC